MAIFTNMATLSYNGNVTNSNITTGELIEILTAYKTPVVDEYFANEEVTYVVNLVNTESTALTGLTVTDNLGAYAFGATTLYPLTYIEGSAQYFAGGVPQATPTITAGPPLEITGITVPANSNATIVYSARVNAFAPLGQTAVITNTATVTGGGILTPVTTTAEITMRTEPDLRITKALSPATVTENGQLTYTFTIQNFSATAADADDNVVLSDTFAPALNSITVTFNGTTWATPANYTYVPATGLFSTVARKITVPAATFSQDTATGVWEIIPGTSTLTVTGTI